MNERKAGWYWVRRHGTWLVGHYHDSGIWRLTSTHINHYDADFAEIGPRIPAPDETEQPPWMQAADDMLVVSGMGTAESSDDIATAKRKLGELIDWHVAVALDERVNGGYRLVPVEATPKP